MGPWWAWIGVLAVTVSSLLARGFDVSDAGSAAWTVFLLVGALIAVVRIALRFVVPRGETTSAERSPDRG